MPGTVEALILQEACLAISWQSAMSSNHPPPQPPNQQVERVQQLLCLTAAAVSRCGTHLAEGAVTKFGQSQDLRKIKYDVYITFVDFM